MLHLGGGKTLLVRNCVCVVTISISFDVRLALGAAAAAASPLVPPRPPVVAVVALAPAQASFTLRLATPAACAGQSERTPHDYSQSRERSYLSQELDIKHTAAAHWLTSGQPPWRAYSNSAVLAHSMCTAGLNPLKP